MITKAMLVAALAFTLISGCSRFGLKPNTSTPPFIIDSHTHYEATDACGVSAETRAKCYGLTIARIHGIAVPTIKVKGVLHPVYPLILTIGGSNDFYRGYHETHFEFYSSLFHSLSFRDSRFCTG